VQELKCCTDGCGLCSPPRKRLLEPPEILGSVLDEVCRERGIRVERVPLIYIVDIGRDSVVGKANGGQILMREDLGVNSPEHLSTWVHELAHELLHYPKDKPRTFDPRWAEDMRLGDLIDAHAHRLRPQERVGMLNRLMYPISPIRDWECEAESVALHFFAEAGLPWAKLALHYKTVGQDELTNAQRAVMRLLLKRFRALRAQSPVAPSYLWNVVPADPRYCLVSSEITGFKRLLPLPEYPVEAP